MDTRRGGHPAWVVLSSSEQRQVMSVSVSEQAHPDFKEVW